MSSRSNSDDLGADTVPRAGAASAPARRGPWALSLLAAIALHAAAVTWVPAPGAMTVSSSVTTGPPLQVRWIAARTASAGAVTADARDGAGDAVRPPPAAARVEVPAATPATGEGVAAVATGAHPVRHGPSDDATHELLVLDSVDGSTGVVVAKPDVPMPGPVTVLRLTLSVDPEGHVASLDALDDDALDALVDAVRDAFVGQLLPAANATAAPRWRLEVRFVEGESQVRWRLWRVS